MNRGLQRDVSSRDLRRTANKLMEKMERDVAGYVGRCLFVVDDNGGYCNEPVSNNCHIVSEKAVLVDLRDHETQKVFELNWGVSQWRSLVFSSDVEQRVKDATTFEPSPEITHDACIGRFACKPNADHDNEFQPIDVADPAFDDPIVRFLAGYRSVLFLADQYRLAIKFYEQWDRTAKGNNDPRNRNSWRAEKSNLERGLHRAEINVKLLGKNWHAWKTYGTFDSDLVSAQVLRFRSKLRLAGCVFYGKYTAATIFPAQGDWHKMGLLYLTSDSDLVGEDLDRLAGVARATEVSENYGVTVTNELMTSGWGSLALSPESYEGLNDGERLTIQNLIAKHTRDVEPLKSIIQRSLSSARGRR